MYLIILGVVSRLLGLDYRARGTNIYFLVSVHPIYGMELATYLLIQIIVMSNKGLGSSSSRNLVHHRGLNLSEVAVVQEVSDVTDNLGASAEHFAGAVVHDKIQVALTEAKLLILESVVLRGNGVQAWGEKHDL